MLTKTKINDHTQWSMFATKDGCEEHFFALQTPQGISFISALEALNKNYSLALKRAGISKKNVVFSRLFLSDISNQQQSILNSSLFKALAHGAISVIEQKPVMGGPISLLAYHLNDNKNCFTKKRSGPSVDSWQNSLMVKGTHYSVLLTANFSDNRIFDSAVQTKSIFGSLGATVAQNGMTLIDNTIRTWVFVRDVDNHYKDMVRARKKFFSAHGLTEKTRYIASTGIQGDGPVPGQLVTVDSLSIGGLCPGQIVRMEAPEHLSPTIQYGVTFERGLRVRFGDRSHLYISGTASINNKGEVLFRGNAERQAERTIENIRALLAAHRATLDDMAYIIAYVRNFHDREPVSSVLAKEINEKTPLIFAEAPVCRPMWLVELEGVAIVPDRAAFPPFR